MMRSFVTDNPTSGSRLAQISLNLYGVAPSTHYKPHSMRIGHD